MKRLRKLQESLPTEDFTPRDYQLDLLENARHGNTIAALGSDGGKSFLALSLLRELTQEVRQDSKSAPKKVAFITIESDEAADNYVQAVEDHTDFSAVRLTEFASLESLRSYDVVVSSHQNFVSLITERRFDPADISVIAIDECTSAVAKYPYGQLFHSVFPGFRNGTVESHCKPRILALTSSLLTKDVVSDPSTLERVIAQLEQAFRSSLRTSVSLISVDRFGYSKDIKVVPYTLEVREDQKAGTALIKTKLEELLNFVRLCTFISKQKDVEKADCLVNSNAFNIFEVAASETLECLRVLGLWPTYRLINIITRDFRNTYLKNLMEQRSSRILLAVTCLFQEIGIALEKAYGFGTMAKGDERILEFVSDKLRLIVEMMNPYNPQNPEAGKGYIPVQYFSMIINVNKPYLAWAINRFIRDLKSADRKCSYGYITSSYCLGSFSSETVLPTDACFFGMPFKVQEEILRRFRNRDFNVLVSTCTNDISLDVPQCTFSIQFDPVLDYLTYVHARHRTKSKYGTMCIMILKDEEAAYRQEYFSKFERIDSMVLSRCPDHIIRTDSVEVGVFDVLSSPLQALSTGVQITMNQAIGVINRYCSNLPSDAFANLTPLSYLTKSEDSKWQIKLTLPINAPLKNAVLGLQMSSQKLAKQSAALEACKELYRLGELDESLAPVSKDTWKSEISRLISLEAQEVIPDGAPKPGTTKRRQYYTKRIPAVLTNSRPASGDRCYLFVIQMTLICPVPQEQNIRGRKIRYPEKSDRLLGILSTMKLPSIPDFNIYDRSGEIRVSIKLVAENVLVEERNQAVAQHFHYLLFSSVLALDRYSLCFSPDHSPAQYLIVPLSKCDAGLEVDWNYMESIYAVKSIRLGPVAEEERNVFLEETFSDAVVMPWYRSLDQPQSFYVEQICPWLTVECEFPDDTFETFGGYYVTKYLINIQDKKQPLLDVDHTSTRLNLLLPRFLSRKGSSLTQTEKKELLKDKETRHRQILVPELCKVHPVPASLWRQGICLPTILHRMESLLVMEELRVMIKNSTGISSQATRGGSNGDWPLLDYGWSFEEKIKQIDSTGMERDDLDMRNASIIEKARLKHESVKKLKPLPTIGMWNAADPDNSDFEIGSWNDGGVDTNSFAIDTWNPAPNNPEWSEPVSFFDHVKSTYGDILKQSDSSRVTVKEPQPDLDDDTEWGYNGSAGLPGICLVSGFSDNVMQAIEKDLSCMNLDDSGMTASETGDVVDDMETIADSVMTALPSYNIEALDPLKDREEEDFGPVMSSILHLRFSESAPDDFRTRVGDFTDTGDVFDDMSTFCPDGAEDSPPKKDEKKKDLRVEFGEVNRIAPGEKDKHDSFKANLTPDFTPKIIFDDDRDPVCVAGPDPGILLQAFTSSNANDGINLERLETVGDSFLKFSVTAYLYFRYSGYHEGKLSFMRSLQVSNYHLYRLGFKKRFGEVLVSSKFEPTENWLPPCYVLEENLVLNGENSTEIESKGVATNLRTQHCISDKTLADCVESLIGAYLISSGVKAAQLLMSWLGLVVLPERPGYENSDCMLEKYTWFPKPATVLLSSTPEVLLELNRLLDGYSKFEDRIGYKFKDRAYLLQAFTHASYTYNRITDCYQRLEFLGDAVLDYLITRHLFEDLRGHTPGALTDLRSALVNNSIFASLSVRYEFHKYVKLMSPAIFHLVEKYVKEQRERDQNMTLFTEDIYFYDPAADEDTLEDEGGAEETECPKVLGDVFESVAGAIYLDSGMSLDAVWKVYYAMMKSEIDQCSSIIPKSPVRELLEMEPENVKFSIPERTASGKIRVVVEIFDKGKFVGLGRNYRTAKCTAAKQALKYLHSLEESRAG